VNLALSGSLAACGVSIVWYTTLVYYVLVAGTTRVFLTGVWYSFSTVLAYLDERDHTPQSPSFQIQTALVGMSNPMRRHIKCNRPRCEDHLVTKFYEVSMPNMSIGNTEAHLTIVSQCLCV